MDLSLYLKHFPLIFRLGTTLDTETGMINWLVLACTLTSWISVMVANSFNKGLEGNGIPVRAIYETVVFCCTAAHIPFLIRRRGFLLMLVSILRQPFHSGYLISQKPISEYAKSVNRFGNMYIFYHIFFVSYVMLAFSPLLTLPFYPADTPIPDLPLPVGCIPFSTQSYAVYSVAYFISAFAIATTGMFNATWHLIMIFCSLLIKARLQLLVDSIVYLDRRSRGILYHGLCPGRISEALSSDRLAETVQTHVQILELGRLFNKFFSKTLLILFQSTMIVIAVLVIQTVGVRFDCVLCRLMRLFNKCFSMTLLILFQSTMVVIAVLVLQTVDSDKYDTRELLTGISLSCACLIVLGIFNYSGQTIINENDRLHLELYKCDWISKPTSYKKNHLMMMNLTSRPVYLTVGGLYPLSMESYGNIMKAVYSYINILMSLQKRQTNN